jgi:hypothetical protein
LLAQSWVLEPKKLRLPMPSMKPLAKTGWSTPKPAAVPTYMDTLCGDTERSSRTFEPISSIAWRHGIGTKSSPTRFRGCVSRSFDWYRRICFSPFTQAKPALA